MSFARAFIQGRLCRDPELKFTASNMAVCNVSLAVNKSFTTAAGEKKEEVSFFDCVAFGKTAENLAKFFTKGRMIIVEADPKQETWDDKNGGGKRSKVVFIINQWHFCDSPDRAGDGSAPAPATARAAAPSPGGQNKPAPVTAAQRKTMAGMVSGGSQEYVPIDADSLPF
jgi:single-strand DNA-binding protein